MVTIIFPDRKTEKRALAFLIGRFSGCVLKSGEHLVPEAALKALADQNIPFTVKGKTTYEQIMALGLTDTPPAPPSNGWRETVGMFDHDPIMLEILEAGRRIREADRSS